MHIDTLIIFSAKYVYLLEIALLGVYFLIQTRETQKKIFVLSAIFFPLTYIAAQIAAMLYLDPRPFVTDGVIPLITHTSDNGFPSDHMLLTSAIASFLFVYNKKVGALAWIIAVIVGVSRVYAGVHHFTDIIGSAAIALISIWFTKRYILPCVLKTKLYKRFFETESH